MLEIGCGEGHLLMEAQLMSQHSQSAVLNIVYSGSVSAHFGQAA